VVPGSERDLVLVGGGHAHVQLIRRWAREPLEGVRLSVVVADPIAVYSGMLPGLVVGQYEPQALAIDVGALAKRAAARLISVPALRIDARARRIELEGQPALPYDVASLNVGSTVAGRELPGISEHAFPTRPLGLFIGGLEQLLARARGFAAEQPFRLVVAGAGAGGIELAFCLQQRLTQEARCSVEVTLVEGHDRILPGAPRTQARSVERAARARGIRIRSGSGVRAAEASSLRLENGRSLPFDALVWTVGAAPPALVRDSDLPKDARGFVRVRSTFQVVGQDALLAVGDCATLESFPGLARAGVYAVRSAAVLDHNLRASLRGHPLRSYRPQRDFLSLLNLGDGSAIGTKWGLTLRGRWLMRLKDAIDRRFVDSFR